MGTTKKCPYCGQEIDVKSKFCVFCGAKQEMTPDSPQGITYETGVAYSPDNIGASLFKSCFWEQITKHYCDFKGNVGKMTFKVCYHYYFLIVFLTVGVFEVVPLLGILCWVLLLGLIAPFLGLHARRLHDIGREGTWKELFSWNFFDLMRKDGVTHDSKKWKVKDTIITIAMAVVSLVLLFAPIHLKGKNDYEEPLSVSTNTTSGDDSPQKRNVVEYKYIIDEELSAKIEKQVIEDYKTQAIYDRTTSDFDEAERAALVAEDTYGYLCVDGDFFYQSQDLDLEQINVKAHARLLDKENAHVFITLYSEPQPSLVLVMLRDVKTGNWLVDDIKDVDNQYSVKEELLECAKEMQEIKWVDVDVSDLWIRYAPSAGSEALKSFDGKIIHPNKGAKFEYLGESGDFYKIRYDDKELWVSKRYTHIE